MIALYAVLFCCSLAVKCLTLRYQRNDRAKTILLGTLVKVSIIVKITFCRRTYLEVGSANVILSLNSLISRHEDAFDGFLLLLLQIFL